MATPPPPPPSAPPPPPASVPPPPPPPAPAAKGGNRTLIIVLCVLGGILLLIGGCVTTCTYIAAKKTRDYANTAGYDPRFAAISRAASRAAAEASSPAREAALAAGVKKLPGFLQTYPGAKTTQLVSNSFGGSTQVSYESVTSDSPETVTDFYEKSLTSAGFTVLSRQSGSNDNGETGILLMQHAGSPSSIVSVNAEIEHSNTKVTITSTTTGQ